MDSARPWLLAVVLSVIATVYLFLTAKARSAAKSRCRSQTALSRSDNNYLPREKDQTQQRLTIVYPPSNHAGVDDAEVDIVAVHGLGSNVDWSWVYKDGESRINWLQDLDMLPAKVPKARIITYRYESTWHADAPRMRLQLCGEELVHSLYTFRASHPNRPIILVGHSLGGNVIVQAILHANDDTRYKSLLKATVGLVFLGTPFRGSKWQLLADTLAQLMRPAGSHRGITKELRFDEPALRDALHRFLKLCKELSTKVACFSELYETDLRRRFKLAGFAKGMIVEETSACIPGCDRYALNKDHVKINKYYGPTDPAFETVSSVISEMSRGAPEIVYQSHLKVCQGHLWSSASQARFAQVKSFVSADWIFHQEAFQRWQSLDAIDVKEVSRTLLTIKGKAFTGKSVLIRKAIESLKEKNVITLNHFFGGVSSDPTAEFLRNLLGQLLSAIPNEHKPWPDIRRWSDEIENNRCVDFLSCDKLQEDLTRILQAKKDGLAVRIFVDGIDDRCGDHSNHAAGNSVQDRNRPLRVLQILGKILKDAGDVKMDLGICVSRQPQPEYPDMEPPATTISLVPYMDVAIKSFIREKLQCISDQTKFRRLLLRLSETGAHNFQWATAVCEEIIENKEYDFEELMEIASRVPVNHEEMYCRALRSSKTSKTHDCLLRLLQVALGSFRPLTAEEFRQAYAAASEAKFGSLDIIEWEKSDRGVRAKYFGNFLSKKTNSLLETVAHEIRPRYSSKDAVSAGECAVEHNVLFQQRSAESFLRSDKALRELGIASASQFERDCHLLLFRACGSVLEKCNLPGKDDLLLVDYACEYWLRHSRLCGKLPRELPGFMNECTHPKAQIFIKEQIYKLRNKRECVFLEEQTSMMVLLATLGCTALLRRHLDTCRSCRSSIPGTSDAEPPPLEVLMTALGSAIQVGKAETAMYLLDFLPPTEIDKRGNDKQTLLYMACCSARDSTAEGGADLKLVKMIIERGASPNVPSVGVHELPLHLAIGEANEPLIEALCAGYKERDPELLVAIFEYMHPTTGWPALHYALQCKGLTREKRLGVLRTLREEQPTGADLLTLPDRDGVYVDDVAIEIGDEAMINKLMEF